MDISPPADSTVRVCSGSASPEATLLLRFKSHAEQCGYNAHTVEMNISALREFLSYLEERDITAEAARPPEVVSFFPMRPRNFSRLFTRSPKTACQCEWRYCARF